MVIANGLSPLISYCVWIAQKEYEAERAGIIAGIVLAVMVPLLILAYCCFRRQRRNHKKGLENKTLKMLTTSRHSLNENGGHGFTTVSPTKAAHVATSWKKENSSSSSPFSSGIGSARSSPPDQEVKTDASTTSTFDRGSSTTRSPVSSGGSKASPSESQSSSSQGSRHGADSAPANNIGQKNRRISYDGVYYTHEPIRGAPVIDFEDKNFDVEINHRNTEVWRKN